METLADNVRYPDITFGSDGLISISSSVASRLGLKQGDTINVIPDNGEYFLVARHSPRDSQGRAIAHYRNAVSYVKRGKGHMRCNFQKLCTAINFITQAPVSALFCGTPREGYRGYDIALPLITNNNQYHPE